MPNEDVLRRAARHNLRERGKLLRLAFGFAAADRRSDLSLADIAAAEGLVVDAEPLPPIGFMTSSTLRDGTGDRSGTRRPGLGPSRGSGRAEKGES